MLPMSPSLHNIRHLTIWWHMLMPLWPLHYRLSKAVKFTWYHPRCRSHAAYVPSLSGEASGGGLREHICFSCSIKPPCSEGEEFESGQRRNGSGSPSLPTHLARANGAWRKGSDSLEANVNGFNAERITDYRFSRVGFCCRDCKTRTTHSRG